MDNNYSLFLKLKNRLKDNQIRYELIFHAVRIGSYNARIEHPEDFDRFRQMTGKIQEATYISREIRYLLDRLKKQSPIDVLKEMEHTPTSIEKMGYITDGMYSYFKEFWIKGEQENVGNRLERKLLKNSKKLEENFSDRDIKNNLINEQFTMISALVYENSND